MLCSDLACLADQLEAHAVSGLPLRRRDVAAIVRVLREGAGRAAVLEAMPVPRVAREDDPRVISLAVVRGQLGPEARR